MPGIELTKCLGLDTRQTWGDDSFRLRIGNNIQILPGGVIASRPALRSYATVDANATGLYQRGGYLRCIVPSGQGLEDTAPSGFRYDPIGRGGTYDYTGLVDSIVGAETFGFDNLYGPNGYVAIKRADSGVIEHHWIKAPPADSSTYADTYISTLGFTPGTGLVKLVNKIFCTDPVNGYLRYCSSLNGPTDWSTAGDAGFELARQFVSGDQEMIALGVHRGVPGATGNSAGTTALIAILYQDAVQLWYVSEDPNNNIHKGVLNGPGTIWPLSITNVHGDLFFLSRNGFSNLENVITTGQSNYGDIGAAISSLTAGISNTDTPVALWSQKRSQGLWFVGTTVYVYNYYPKWNEASFATWTMPVSVSSATELDGVVYVRSGNDVYSFDDSLGTDYNGTDIAWQWQPQPFGMGDSVLNKALRRIAVQCTANATYTPIADERTLTNAAIRMTGGAGVRSAQLFGRGRRISVDVSGSGLMRFNGMTIAAEQGGP